MLREAIRYVLLKITYQTTVLKTWIFNSSNVIITKIFGWIQVATAFENIHQGKRSKDILPRPWIALQDLRSRPAAKISLEIYSNAANPDSGQLNTFQRDIPGRNICSATFSSSLLLLSLFDGRFFFPWFPSGITVIQEKKQTVYGISSSKLFSKHLVIQNFSFETPSTQRDLTARTWYFDVIGPTTEVFNAFLITLLRNWRCGLNSILYFILKNITYVKTFKLL